MITLQKIGIMSLAKIHALMGFIIGVFMGLYLMILPITAGFGQMKIAFVLIFPFVYALFTFILGILTALCYNLASKWIGGIEIELQK